MVIMKEVIRIPSETYSVGLNHDVEYKRVRACREGEGNDTLYRGLNLQIMIPRPEDRSRPQGTYPVVIYSPGGGWKTPLVRYRLPIIVDLAKRGFVVVMAEYRGRESFNSWREPVSDVRSAVRFITRDAAKYCIDPENIFLLGDSAGAHLSLLAGIRGEEFDDPNDDLSIPVRIRGILELFGPTDLAGIERELHDEKALDHPVTPIIQKTFEDFARSSDPGRITDVLNSAGVISRISLGTEIPPVLIAQGTADIIVPTWSAEKLYEALRKAGKETEYYLLEGARHGDMRFYGKVMMDRYEQFIRKHAK